MSVSSTNNGSCRCTVCGDQYQRGDGGPAQNICSERCYYRQKGTKALNHVRNDHRHCSSCGRQRAEIELPKPEEAFAVDESYDAAWNVVDGNVTYENYGQEESSKAAIGFRHPTIHEEGEACKCGTIERTGDGHFDVLGDIETDAILLRLRKRIKEAAIDGQREDWPSKGDLLRTFEESGDLAYSIGVSL